MDINQYIAQLALQATKQASHNIKTASAGATAGKAVDAAADAAPGMFQRARNAVGGAADRVQQGAKDRYTTPDQRPAVSSPWEASYDEAASEAMAPLQAPTMNWSQIGRDAAMGGAGLGAAGAVGGGAYYGLSPEESYANQLRQMSNQHLGTNFDQRSRIGGLLGRGTNLDQAEDYIRSKTSSAVASGVSELAAAGADPGMLAQLRARLSGAAGSAEDALRGRYTYQHGSSPAPAAIANPSMLDYSELASSMPRVPRMAPEIGAAPPITHAGMNYGQIGRDAAIGGAGLGAAGAAGGGAYYAMSPEESYANQLRAMANQNLGTDFEQRSRLAAALGR